MTSSPTGDDHPTHACARNQRAPPRLADGQESRDEKAYGTERDTPADKQAGGILGRGYRRVKRMNSQPPTSNFQEDLGSWSLEVGSFLRQKVRRNPSCTVRGAYDRFVN